MTMIKKRLSKVRWAALRSALVVVIVTLSSSAEAQVDPEPDPGGPVTPITGPDTDGDGVPDAVELFFDTDLENSDTDGDGVSDFDELRNCDCDPLQPDTNRDGLCDGEFDIPGVCQAGNGTCVDNGDPETRYQLRGSGGCDQSSPASTTSTIFCAAMLTFFLRRRRRTLR